jgi:hypothetical protein
MFDIEEIRVARSPAEAKVFEITQSEKVLDYDVAKDGPLAAILIQDQAGGGKVTFWDPGAKENPKAWAIPKGLTARSLAWHPAGKSFFLSGKQGSEHVIARVDQRAGSWNLKLIYRTPLEIRRLIPAPRPFEIVTDDVKGETMMAWRVFFGVRNQEGRYAIKSVTEDGGREYQVVGPRKGFTNFKNAFVQPSRIEAFSALPLGFHPAGHLLLWEDEKRCFQYAVYDRDHWEESVKLTSPGVCGGSVTVTPNGLGLIHWRPDTPGVTFISQHGRKKELLAAEYTFLSTPSSVPDGRGIVGLIKKDNGAFLAYVPIRIPLAEVANAWMFAEGPEDQELFGRKGGLFRDLADDQLYSMYESEAYECGGYDRSTPTRPYLVTTDVFWELLAAAYEGLFIVKERQQAIPAFWEFIAEAERNSRQAIPNSRWSQVFSTLQAMRKPPRGEATNAGAVVKEELARIQRAGGREFSPVLGTEVDYSELKPRGHYHSSEDMKAYFKAFKYLTQLAGNVLPLDDLRKMPSEVKGLANSWIAAYSAFIAPSRAPLFWKDGQGPPPYAKHALEKPGLFPLSWGVDNEVLLSTVYHADWPEAEQIKGPSGARLIPSGLDIASALGSEFATALLAGELEKYPSLHRVIENLRARLPGTRQTLRDDRSLYSRWIVALALQWADNVRSPGGSHDRELWLTKRLQTGLASWATLRHATVLVNERSAAECGEAGFERILLTPPRGYVEPDPATYGAIAELFDTMEQMVGSWNLSNDLIQVDDGGEREALKQGVRRRLSETAAKIRLFKRIAEKEIAGEVISNQEYEEILTIGRIAEHHFLIFKSLANQEYALSNPDPMPKIADVAGGGPYNVPYLMAAVGKPMEWDHIVPYFGRSQIVKGAVYSYYEFPSDRLLTDEEWRKLLPSRKHPIWVSPYLSKSVAACPPKNPF